MRLNKWGAVAEDVAASGIHDSQIEFGSTSDYMADSPGPDYEVKL